MRRLLPFILFILSVLSAAGAGVERITLLLTITNLPQTSNSLTINASTRIWTNASTISTILTNLQGTNFATTNLYNQIASYPFGGGIALQYASSNAIRLIGTVGGALAGSAGAGGIGSGWASIVLSTQSGPQTYTALWPIENMVGATNRTNEASAFVSGISTFSTQAFATNAAALSNFLTLGAAPQQYIAGSVQVAGILRAAGGIANTNGIEVSVTNINPILSNAVNYGNAIRSEGSGGNGLQLGSNAIASSAVSVAVGASSISAGANSSAFGASSTASNSSSTAIGTLARATNTSSTALGVSSLAGGATSVALGSTATALGLQSTAVGAGAAANGSLSVALGTFADAPTLGAIAIGNTAEVIGTNAIGIGVGVTAGTSNGVAIGFGANANRNFQIALGDANSFVTMQALEAGAIRSLHAIGTNQIDGIFAFTNSLAVSSVAPGHNVIDSKTNTILYLTGAPGTAWTLGGFTGDKTDGRLIHVWNQTGFDVTIQNESGTAPTASDRILTYASAGGTNATLIGNGLMKFQYSATASRWLMMLPAVDVSANSTNGVNSVSTNGSVLAGTLTSLNFVGNNNVSVNQSTNTAGAVSIQFAPILFSATNYGTIYDIGDWLEIMNEEFIGSIVSTVSGRQGTHDWTVASAGTLPSLAAPIADSNAWSFISCVTTQTTSGRLWLSPNNGGSPVGFTLTNADFLFEARIRMNATNLANDVCTTRVGLTDTTAANGDPNNGVWAMVNTNATNTILLGTARGGSRTFNYSTLGAYDASWLDVFIYVPSPCNTAYLFIGKDRFRLTSVATNTATLPGDTASLGGTFQVDRMASTSGLFLRTNYIDRMRLWVRQMQ